MLRDTADTDRFDVIMDTYYAIFGDALDIISSEDLINIEIEIARPKIS